MDDLDISGNKYCFGLAYGEFLLLLQETPKFFQLQSIPRRRAAPGVVISYMTFSDGN